MASEMAQQAKMFVSKAADLSSVPGTHMVEELGSQMLLSDGYTHTMARATHTYTGTKKIGINLKSQTVSAHT